MRSAPGICLAIALALGLGTAAAAHEFWIAPGRFQLAPGDPVAADLMVGQMLRGEPYPYLSDRFTRFTVTAGDQTIAVAGLDGDLPALGGIPARPGLNVIAHQTIPFRVTYADWAVFRKYLAYEGLDRFAELHHARGLPETGFAERYTRYAKALIQAGPAKAEDRDSPLGLAFELVAAANPYSPGLEGLPVTLTWNGTPVGGHQITVFADDGAEVTRSTATTDQSGSAVIPLGPGRRYLLNAVRLDPVDGAPVVWHSHWASLTFGTGEPGD